MDLELNIGDMLHLERVPSRERARVRLIGLVPGRSLLVTAPEGAAQALAPGEALTARVFGEREVLAFSCSVQAQHAEPYPYFHLSYPAGLEPSLMRQARRARVQLAATVESDAQPGQRAVVSLRDISTLGAQVWSGTALGAAGSSMVVRLPLEIEAGDPLQAVELVCEIRNVQHDPAQTPGWRYGVEFATMSSASALAVRSLVMRQLGAAAAPKKV